MIINKIQSLLKNNNKLSFIELTDFIEKEFDNTIILTQDLKEVLQEKKFLFQQRYENFSITILISIYDVDDIGKVRRTTKLKMKDMVFILS